MRQQRAITEHTASRRPQLGAASASRLTSSLHVRRSIARPLGGSTCLRKVSMDSKHLNSLLIEWQSSRPRSGIYLFRPDWGIYSNTELREKYFSPLASLEEFTAEQILNKPNSRLHVGLIPQPYFGNLQKASIFILMLNPGLSASDFYAEQHHKEYRRALLESLHQENAKQDFPFLFLNPEFSWHQGFDYWYSRLKKVVKELHYRRPRWSYKRCLSHLAKNVACLQLVPYHSTSFDAHQLIQSETRALESTKAIRCFAKDVALQAERGHSLVFVLRQSKNWKLGKMGAQPQVFMEDQNRSAHLSERYIKIIAQWLAE